MDAYSQSKLEAEQALRAIEKTTAMKVTVIRSPLVYGPGVRANFLEMIRWISLGIPLPFGALTSNLRSFIGINNLIDFIAVCLNNSKAAGQTFLVSDGKDISTVELIRLVAQAMGMKEKLFNVPVWLLRIITTLVKRTKEFERLANSFQVDISYSFDRLNWVPVEPLDQAIHHAVQSFRR
jgi:nucleoside-diphosphate-sugar epimerase